jgi:adhesin transport system outer membrane protein
MQNLRSLLSLALLAVLPSLAAAQLPPQLRDAARQAVVSNPEVQARWSAFRAAEAEQDVARGGFLPQVDLTAGVGRERLRQPGESTESFNRRGAVLSLNQMVYDGFFTRNEVKRLGHARLVRYHELVDASESAALEAVRAYADVLRYREQVTLAKQNYVEHKRVHDQIAERANAGVGRRVDLEQATGRLALAESNLLTEVSNLHDVSARYLRIVGAAPADTLAPMPESIGGSLIPASAGDALRAALSTNAALNAAVENVRAGQAQVDSRRAANQPRLDLRARQAVDRNLDGVNGTTREGVVELVLNYNLYRGGADQARIRQAADELNLSKDLREKACRDLRQTLSIAYNDSQRLSEQLGYLDQHQLSIEKAREAYRRQFDIGQRTLLDLLDTENEYFQARRAYVNARYDLVLAQARTLAGMGTLMRALDVAREDMPTQAELGAEQEALDPASICPPEAPTPLEIDKKALFEEALREAGASPAR